jgi:SWI/SNF-related matrix-associated actin-dependent regulator 1 of chromatin subfamily A
MTALFPYQEQGAAWLATKARAYLADEMRLGKSAQAIRAADTVHADSILVLCPAVARINWTREFQQFARRFRTITPVLSAADLNTQADVIVSSYELSPGLPARQWDLLIADEAHYLKSLDAARAKTVLGANGLVHAAARTWFLSGTPTPNNPSELWTVLYVSGVTRLGFDQFVSRYCKGRHTPYGFKITGEQNIGELREAIKPFLLRRTKAQVRPEMPQVLISHVTVEPGPVDLEANFLIQWLGAGGNAGVMNAVANEHAKVVNAWKTPAGFAALEAIAESTPIYRRYVGLQKIEPVAELVRAQLEADPKMKIVLFAWHRDVINGLRLALQGFGPVTLYGGTPPEKRQRNIDNFNNNPKTRVFIGNILAAGTAIPLTGAHHGLIVEPSWVPGDNAQAIMRMDGPMQTEQITVQMVSIAGTIDEDIQRANVLKTKMQSALFS